MVESDTRILGLGKSAERHTKELKWQYNLNFTCKQKTEKKHYKEKLN